MLNINFSFYKDHDNAPIEKVADALGINVTRGNKILCPCHDDHNPSCILTTSGKFENKFKCWSCNESGGPIELVMAVKYGITPSQYREHRSQYAKQLLDSVKFLDKIFPGGTVNLKQSKSFIPEVPPEIFKEIGFPVYYFDKGLSLQRFLDVYYQKDEAPQDAWNRVRAKMPASTFYDKRNLQDLLEISEKIDFLSERIDDFLKDEEKKQLDFQKKYPDMPPEGRRYMVQVFSDKFEQMTGVIEQLHQFRDTFIEPVMDEIHREYLDDKEADELRKIKTEKELLAPEEDMQR